MSFNEESSIIDYSNLEKIISDNTDYLSSSLVSLQFIEHSYNSISIFDKRTNKHLSRLLEEYIEDIYSLIETYGDYPRYLPKDNYQVLLEFCIEHIKHIIKSPKELLIKEPKMLRLDKIEYISPRTINYLSTRPGETVREKLLGTKKLLADKKRFTTNIKENQCTLYLLNKLEKQAKERLKNATEKELYHIVDEEIKKVLEQILHLKTSIKKYSISEASIKKSTIPNNALLSHKNYSIIWKSLNYLTHFNLKEKIKNIEHKFVHLFQLSLFSSLYKSSLSILYNDVFNILDNNYFTYLTHNNKSLNNYQLILEHQSYKDKLLKVNISIKDKMTIICKFESMILDNDKKIFIVSATEECSFNFKLNDKYEHNRGLSFTISSDKSSKTAFADFKDFTIFTSFALEQIKKLNILKDYFYLVDRGESLSSCYDNLIIDFTSYDSSIFLEDEESLYFKNLFSISNIDNRYYATKDFHFYRGNNIISFNSIYSKEEDTVKRAFEFGLKKLSEYYSFNNVISLMPDSISEIDQVNIRRSMNHQFSSLFYIWRSVACACALQIDMKNIKEEYSVLVIDLLDSVVAGTKLEFSSINNGGKKVSLWKHYPIIYRLEDDNLLSFNNICINYLKAYNRKFKIVDDYTKLEFLLDSGIVASVLRDKTGYSFNIDDNIYFINFDDSIYKEVLKEINVDNILKPYFNKYKFDSIIFIYNDFYKFLKSKLHLKKEVHYFSNEELATGAYFVYSNWLNSGYSWIEYLPSLSLEVVKNGRYHLLELVGENSYITMGADFEIDVEEHLLLPANKKEIMFPLIRDIKNKGKRLYAFIRGDFLPLKNDLSVKLKVKYKYGYDDSYELLAYPTDKNNSPFEYTNIKFDTYTKVLEDRVIDFSNQYKSRKKASSLEYGISKKMNELYSSIDIFKRSKIYFKLDYFFNILIDINDLLQQVLYSDTDFTSTLISLNSTLSSTIKPMFLNKDNLLQIQSINADYINIYIGVLEYLFLRIDILSNKILNNNNFIDMYKKAKYLWSNGSYKEVEKAFSTMKIIKNKSILSLGYNKYLAMMRDIFRYLLCEERNKENIDIFLDIYDKFNNKDFIISRLGIVFSHDPDLFNFLLEYYPSFVDDIKTRVFRLLEEYAINDSKNILLATDLRGILLVFIFFLRLRSDKYYPELRTGKKLALKISDYIKKIDSNIYHSRYYHYRKKETTNLEQFNKISILQFSMDKGKLNKMCNLTYVINALLTGDDGGNAITVTGVSDDE